MEAAWSACRGTTLLEERVNLREPELEKSGTRKSTARKTNSRSASQTTFFSEETVKDYMSGCGHLEPAKTKRKNKCSKHENRSP
jgi:hypothetical protein